VTDALQPVSSFEESVCSSIQPLKKLQHPADRDVRKVTFFRKLLKQVPVLHRESEYVSLFHLLICICHTQDCLPAPFL
jgi:hypothetical protein